MISLKFPYEEFKAREAEIVQWQRENTKRVELPDGEDGSKNWSYVGPILVTKRDLETGRFEDKVYFEQSLWRSLFKMALRP